MTYAIYMEYEILRTVRNWRFMVFSLAFPLILVFVFAGSNQHTNLDGISFPLYYMTGMAAWGSITAVMSTGARISSERQAGWTRQLKITPLPTLVYFRSKILSGYMMALISLLALFAAGTSLGVSLTASQWLTTTLLLLIGLIPFAVMGIIIGHLLNTDSIGPAMGGVTTLFSLFGGAWGPLASGGLLLTIAKGLPSYWLVQAAKTSVGHTGWWPAEAWVVLAIWTVALVRLAAFAYRRDTARQS